MIHREIYEAFLSHGGTPKPSIYIPFLASSYGGTSIYGAIRQAGYYCDRRLHLCQGALIFSPRDVFLAAFLFLGKLHQLLVKR